MKILYVGDQAPYQHNYFPKLEALVVSGAVSSVGVHHVNVYHDNWCGIHAGGACDCEPDVELGKP